MLLFQLILNWGSAMCFLLVFFASTLIPCTLASLPHLQGKALSVADQFSLPNSQYMISTMAAMGFYSKPLLDICCKRIQGEDQRCRWRQLQVTLLSSSNVVCNYFNYFK